MEDKQIVLEHSAGNSIGFMMAIELPTDSRFRRLGVGN